MTKLVYSVGDLKEVIGLGKWTVYDLIKKDEFPRPIQSVSYTHLTLPTSDLV